MSSASQGMTALGETAAELPRAADKLEAVASTALTTALAREDQTLLEDVFARYTMERERDVHRELLKSFGLAPKMAAKAPVASEDADDGVLFF